MPSLYSPSRLIGFDNDACAPLSQEVGSGVGSFTRTAQNLHSTGGRGVKRHLGVTDIRMKLGREEERHRRELHGSSNSRTEGSLLQQVKNQGKSVLSSGRFYRTRVCHFQNQCSVPTGMIEPLDLRTLSCLNSPCHVSHEQKGKG